MKLHLDRAAFEFIIDKTAKTNGVRRDVLEKDYYVTLLLCELSQKESQGYAYFKGGTALYKALRSIRRFSEDIDLTVFTEDCPTNSSIEKYEELKRLYNAEEWLTVRETVLQNIWKNNRELLPEILLREGMKDRLLKLAVSYPGLYYIQKYEKDLKQEYAEEILGKYKVEFQKLTESASTRDTYREIAKQLRKLSRYDGGKKLVRELVAEWKEKYPKRKAMMEEIDKVIVTNPKERG